MTIFVVLTAGKTSKPQIWGLVSVSVAGLFISWYLLSLLAGLDAPGAAAPAAISAF